jgi:large subunit GTPase 1
VSFIFKFSHFKSGALSQFFFLIKMGAGNTLKKAKQEGKGEGKTQGLGKALMRQRFRQAPQKFVNDDGMVKNNFLSDQEERNMKSVTQESDLESFLQKAELADHDFTAERLSISIVTSYQQTQTAEEKETMKRMHLEYADALQIPKRPDWKTLTKDELIKKEKEEFLNWRRSLVFLEEEKGLILTPYERNIEVWRQLWRVIEKSELVVQIVDARHVMFFRSEDLEKYVSKDSQKVNLLLVNKSDLLTPMQRVKWAEYFEKNNIQYRFFSAHMARDELELERLIVDKFGQQLEFETLDQKEEYLNQYGQDILSKEYAEKLNERENVHPKARIINAIELSKLIDELCPNSEYSLKNGKRTVGFVGYPNVGKSSTLNALIGAQKVAVGSTPGKTKHFQTIHLSDQIILCDCPGLVFPSFATTKAEMVINGVLPIDQLRDHVGPGNLIGERIPKFYLEKIYGIQIKTRNTEGDLCYRPCTAEELFSSYASIYY